ncbi:MAG: FtsX-like permease family protein [Candidatus Sulfobium sp.]
MKLFSMATKDLTRRKGKTLYVLIAVAIPVAILSTIVLTLDNADSFLTNLASKFGFTLMVQPKNIQPASLDQIGVILNEYIPVSVIADVEGIIKQNISGKNPAVLITPRIYQKADIRYRTKRLEAVVAGIDFKKELEARSSWNLDSGTWPAAYDETVLGGTYAKEKSLIVGEKIMVNNREFKIVGLLRPTNAAEDYMVFLPFSVAQKLFDREGLMSVVNVQSSSLDRDKKLLTSVTDQLNNSIPNIKALSPQQFSTMKYILLKKTFRFLLSIAIATIAVSIFSIFNIVTNLLYSRVKEIGMLKSVGASRTQLLIIFLYEYVIVGISGGIIGYLIGLISSYLLDAFFLKIGAAISAKPQFLLIALLVGVFCSLVASFYPTYKLSSIKITETFRTQWEV